MHNIFVYVFYVGYQYNNLSPPAPPPPLFIMTVTCSNVCPGGWEDLILFSDWDLDVCLLTNCLCTHVSVLRITIITSRADC